MKQNTVLVGIVAVIALGLGVFNVLDTPTPIVERPDYGAVSGPNIDSDCLSVNGVTTCYQRQTIRTASTTLCAIKGPSATSTIVNAIAHLATANASYATAYELGLATSQGATTTSLGVLTLAANTNGTLTASTSPTGGSGLIGGVLAPNTYVNFKVSTSSASATFLPTGSCLVTFRVI